MSKNTKDFLEICAIAVVCGGLVFHLHSAMGTTHEKERDTVKTEKADTIVRDTLKKPIIPIHTSSKVR
ncbi:MAG: hypothetical protein J6R22_02400 [Alphaproteobacteria bacterium]|nr:hypothetical protein [Alphaproteobacteria bacterium]